MPHSQVFSNNSYPELIIPIPLRLGLPNGLFPVGLPVKILKALHSGHMTCPFQSCRFSHPYYIRWTVQIWSSSLWSILHSPFSSLLGSNICLRIPNNTKVSYFRGVSHVCTEFGANCCRRSRILDNFRYHSHPTPRSARGILLHTVLFWDLSNMCAKFGWNCSRR